MCFGIRWTLGKHFLHPDDCGSISPVKSCQDAWRSSSWSARGWVNMLVVQLLGHAPLFASPWTAEHQASLSFTISWSLLKLMSIELVMPFNHLFLFRPLLLLPWIFPTFRVLSNELALLIDGQSIGASASALVFPMNIQGWFPLGLTVSVYLWSNELSRVLSSTRIWKHQLFGVQPSLWSNLTSIHDYWKNHSFD